jgi:hypothetical protein
MHKPSASLVRPCIETESVRACAPVCARACAFVMLTRISGSL